MDLSLFTSDRIVAEIYDSILTEVRDEVNIPLDTLTEPLLLGIAVNKMSHGRPSSEYLIRFVMSVVIYNIDTKWVFNYKRYHITFFIHQFLKIGLPDEAFIKL